MSADALGLAASGARLRPAARPRGPRTARGQRAAAATTSGCSSSPGRGRRRSTPASATSPPSSSRATSLVVNTLGDDAGGPRRLAAPTARRWRRAPRHAAADGRGWSSPASRRRTARARRCRSATCCAGEQLSVADGGRIDLLEPSGRPSRLVVATLDPARVLTYLAVTASPIRYRHVARAWPLPPTRPSSPPSRAAPRCRAPAGRSPTELVTRLVTPGRRRRARRAPHRRRRRSRATSCPTPSAIGCRPRPPSRERHPARRRPVVAVGTTVVRALETAPTPTAVVTAGDGWTDLVSPPSAGRAVDGLLTGWHEPQASHLLCWRRSPVEPLERPTRSRPRRRLPLARVRRHPPAPAVSDTAPPARR